MPSEHANCIPGGNSPHTDSMVRAAGENVSRIWMKAHTVNILIMSREYALLANPISHPEACSFVMTARDKIVPVWPPCKVPHWLSMAFVYDNTLPKIERPQADSFVR